MRLCFLVTGLLRDFSVTLFPFLCSIEGHDVDIYIYTSTEKEDSKYLNSNKQALSKLLYHPRIKLFLLHDISLANLTELSQRERNTVYQWYRLEKILQFLPTNAYDWYIRIRPDINFQLETDAFSKIISTLDIESLHIPLGNDIFDASFIRKCSLLPVNDQIAFIPKSLLSIYCQIYSSINLKERPIISEYLLASQLQIHGIIPNRFYLPYTISLSTCKVLAITGDSGSGKSTILNVIEKIFPFDSSVVLETDRYHKWERDNVNWSSMTHLHPCANNLEKLLDDTYRLKLGQDIFTVDYDHSTGKFTDPQHIQSKDIVLLCGLHTLYQDTLRDHIDLKIYVDTQEELKTFWKLQRDIHHRKYTREQVLEKIQKRKQDFTSFILPQKEHANIIFRYETDMNNLLDINKHVQEDQLTFTVEIKEPILHHCFHFMTHFIDSSVKKSNNSILFTVKPQLSREMLCKKLEEESIIFEKDDICQGYLGLIQALVLRILFHT